MLKSKVFQVFLVGVRAGIAYELNLRSDTHAALCVLTKSHLGIFRYSSKEQKTSNTDLCCCCLDNFLFPWTG